MVKVYINTGGGGRRYMSLQRYLDEYHSSPPCGWEDDIKDIVERGMNIQSEEEYEAYIKKMNLRSWDVEGVRKFYRDLCESKLAKIFDDDILKYLAHAYGEGYFRRIGNPNMEEWINTKGVLKPNRDKIPENEKYSLMDLVKLRNGMNAVRHELLFTSKW